jgi:multidrug efflux pump subunit AcrA (membrane-fusion protein)
MNNKNVIVGVVGLTLMLGSCGKKLDETTPVRKDVTETVFASGVLEAPNTYQLTAQADGYLIQVNFEEGEKVPVGKLLAVVDNKEPDFNRESAEALYRIAQGNTLPTAPALQQAQQSIGLNQQKMEQDLIQVQRYRRLSQSNSVSKVEVENAEWQYQTSKSAYESALENYRQLKQQAEQAEISNKAQKKVNEVVVSKNEIRALVSGKVYQKLKQKGDYVKRGEVIATIGQENGIYAKVSIDESNISKVRVGQPAVIQLNTNTGKTYRATVSEIMPMFDETSQSFTCKLTFSEPLDFQIINTQLQSNIETGLIKQALLIPRRFVTFGNMVTIKGHEQPLKIETEVISNEWVVVKSGISEKDIIVTEQGGVDISAQKL